MASIEAVYIIDINGHPIVDYRVSSSPPKLQALIPLVIDSDLSSPMTAGTNAESNVEELSSSRLLFHQKHGNMIFLVPTCSNVSSLMPFEFINRFVEVLEVYFSTPLLPMKLENGLDTVTLILNEMLDDGYPYITEPDPIRDLVPQGGLFSKLLSSSGSRTASQQNKLPTVPWRRSNVRHTNNELFVDIVETLHVIVSSSTKQTRGALPSSSSAFYSTGASRNLRSESKPLLCRVEGTIFLTTHLSGVPDIQLNIDTGKQKVDFPSFHQCVDLQRWEDSPGTLSFIPPDGRSLLASYTIDNQKDPGLVQADLRTGLGTNKDEFEARVWTLVSKDVKHIESLSVNVICDKYKVRSVKNMRVTGGDFHFSNETGVGEWRFGGKTPLGWNATLRGTLQQQSEEELDGEENNSPAIFPNNLSLSYNLTGQVPSGTKVQSLKIVGSRGLGEGVKPYKGVRYITRVGEYVVR